MTVRTTERCEIALNTGAGRVTTAVEVPTGFVPVSSIVPLFNRLSEKAQDLELAEASTAGKVVSCRKGCAACCSMLVPLSAPEAFAIMDYVHSSPAERQQWLSARFDEARILLESKGLWDQLVELGKTDHTIGDDDLASLNQQYYALRVPCPFLQDDLCSIYDVRPAACRELLVTSPSTLCGDMVNNPVEPVAVPLRTTSVLGLLWADLSGTAARLIPLPIVFEWVERHQPEQNKSWTGTELLDRALDKAWRLLSQALSP